MPAHGARLRSTGRRSQVVSVKATANPTDDGFSFTGAAKNMGFDLSDGLFGFTPFSELWVGRLAMIGFAAGMAGEFASGKGILMQVGLCDGTPNYPLFTLLSVAMGTATLAATTKTLVDLNTGAISKTQMGRYAQFFGIDDKATEDASRTLKAEGDFTSPDNFKDIAAARQNMPADAVLGTSFEAELEASTSAASAMQAQGGLLGDLKVSEIDQAKSELKLGGAYLDQLNADLPKSMWLPEQGGLSATNELAYAKDVEMRNGRWAMLGFATAIVVEAGTGMGILPQLITYFKIIGLLGPDSGF